MSSPSLLDFPALLAPVPGDNPCGQDLRYEPAYEQIKAARREGDRDVLGAVGEGADWPAVIDLTSAALATRSKDLMLAAWLTEALTAVHGFAGVRDGLQLVRQLLEQCWDGLYPAVDEGDLEPRAAPLVWLTDADRGARLPNRLRDVSLTPDGGGYSWNYWKARYAPPKAESEDDATYAQRKAEAEEKAKRFEDAVGNTDLAFVAGLHEDIQQAQAALAELNKTAMQRFGGLAPGVTAFRQALEECEALIRRIRKDKGGLDTAAADAVPESATSASPGGMAATGPIGSREDAFRRLAEVSSYLRRTEPQSPVPLLIDRAIAWGQMPFDQLLREMIKDESSRLQVSDLLGIKARTEAAE
jgi:type VI secretion system protein ImpA